MTTIKNFKRNLILLSFTTFFVSCGILIVPVPVSTEVISAFSFSNKKYIELYDGKIDEGNELVKAWDTYSVESTPKKNFIVKVYNPDLDLLMSKITYQDYELLHRTGKVEEWSDSGKKVYEGYFMNNMKAHYWKFYDPEKGYLVSEGKYMNGGKRGIWKEYNEEGTIIKEEEFLRQEKSDAQLAKNENERFDYEMKEFSQLILAECEGKEETASRIECTKEEIMNWQKTVQTRILTEKVSRLFPAIVLFKINKNGESIVKMIRESNAKSGQIIKEELEKRNFLLVEPQNKINENGSSFFIFI